MSALTTRTKKEILDAIDDCGGNWRKVCKALNVGNLILKRLVAEYEIDFAPLSAGGRGVRQVIPLKLALYRIKKDYEDSRDFTLPELCEEIDCYFGAKYTENFTTLEVKKAWGEVSNAM